MGEGLGHASSEAPRLRHGLQRAQPAGRRRQRGGDAMQKAVFQATSPQEGVWGTGLTARTDHCVVCVRWLINCWGISRAHEHTRGPWGAL
eukprot:4872226-Prymnesium_polylepis.1